MTCTDCATPLDDRSPFCGPCLESQERQSHDEPEKTIEQLVTEMMARKRQQRLRSYEEPR